MSDGEAGSESTTGKDGAGTGDGPGRSWRIGEVSRASGVSVRMLRHYDDVGLLRPSRHSAGGHREYSERDALRLETIVALRTLGFSLAEVKGLLEGSSDPMVLIEQQLAALEETLEVLRTARARLLVLLARLERREDPTLADVLEVAGMLTRGRTSLDRETAERLVASRRAAMDAMDEPERADLLARRSELAARLGPDGLNALAGSRAARTEPGGDRKAPGGEERA